MIGAKHADLCIKFQIAPSGPVSIVAGQVGNTFEPFAIGKLGTIELLKAGTFSADAIALSWLAFRPLVAVPILLTAVASIVFAVSRARKAPKPA